MRFWLRKELGWLVLALTMLSLPGPASKACACTRMSTEGASAPGTQLSKKECSRCAHASSAAANGLKQFARASCCKSKVAEASVATPPARLQVERPELRTSLPAAVAPARTIRSERPRSTRAPPPAGSRNSAAPPASYLSDYLRL